RLSHVAITLVGGSPESVRDDAGGSAQAKRCRQCSDSSADITQRPATPAEGRLSQDGSDYGTKYRSARSGPPRARGKCHSSGGKRSGRQMRWNGRTRCALVCICFVLLFSAFSFRLVYLQLVKHDKYAGLAAEKHVYKQPIYAERGVITDVNGEILAHNIPVEIVVADTSHITKEKVAEDGALLSQELKLDPDDLAEKLASDRHYIVLKRDLPTSAADALRAKLREQNLPGIY